ncbi:Negative elongation factor C/D [Actinomortierella ambigua]|uniref:Negative elongation factor C/D n=1 Tax=Actinomortierella ambigua TaxID=1343610 RepID=A0A9P6QKY0_9FUNG|nr:Negative elongation factor C/D [Actinomortierella ambigua]
MANKPTDPRLAGGGSGSGSGGGGGGGGGGGSSTEAMMQSFQAPDSILEPKIFETISAYIREGGQPLLLVNALSNSYVGMPEMCNLMSGWAREFEIDPIEVMQEVLKEQLMERFDPESVDRDFMTRTGTPDWLIVMIQHPFWRQAIYELSEKHQKCALLNFAIQRISDAGHQGEIATVKTASTFVNVFSGVLLDSLDKLRDEDDVELMERLPDLVKVCCQNEHTYLYTQVLLFRLMKTDRGLPMKRISKELESGVLEKFNKLEIMLSSVFVPSFKGGMVKQDHKDKYLWLLAYAASVKETDADSTKKISQHYHHNNNHHGSVVDKSELEPTYMALCALEDTISKRAAGTDLTPILKNLLTAMETPVASMGLLYWIRFVIQETSYIETYFRSHEVLLPLLLLEEMAYKHPLQQVVVFDTLVEFFEAPLDLNPEIMMTYRKSILDRMISLMQLNYVTPAVDYIRTRARKMDQSLAMHFVKRVLEMAQAPYSSKLVEGMAQIIQEIVDAVKKTDLEPLVRAWVDEVATQPITIDIDSPEPAGSASAALQDIKSRLEEQQKR